MGIPYSKILAPPLAAGLEEGVVAKTAPARPMAAAVASSSWDSQGGAHTAFSRSAGELADLGD